MAKPFSQYLHDKFDPKAREITIDYFADNGLDCVPNENKYDIDLIVDEKFYVDVEVKTAWSGHWNNFRFGELNIPDRKKKFLNLDKPSCFMVISKDYSHAFLVKDEILKQCKLEKSPNKYNPNEEFFKVPVRKCLKVKFER